VPTLNLESATNSSESMKLGELLNVTSFTEAPRDSIYTHHTGHAPDVTGGRSPPRPEAVKRIIPAWRLFVGGAFRARRPC
jgi:hypothetical protein